MDIALVLISWKILWGLQMRTAEKFGLILAMSLGILYVQERTLASGTLTHLNTGLR